ncbi:MAG: hypothetical protein HYT62_05360 [Candidatus Yanofskybacteria bacterium]|nr:hypothetical protein [Candidatus Yanofskybacteria bacterium]
MNLANLKNVILSVLMISALMSPGSFSRADSVTPAEEFPFVYLFHLYYDNGRLLADKDFEFKYDLIADQFVQPQLNTAKPFRGEVVSISGSIIGNFKFDPPVAKGKISVKGPHFSNAGKVNFYNDKDELLLIIQVSESSVCNEDKICNADTGESNQNCPSDCKTVPTETPKAQPSLLGRVFSLTNLLGLAVVIILVFLFRWLRSRKNEISSQI